MSVNITVYDGAGVIGGNKILLETADNAIFLDFGTTFATRYQFYEEYLKPRATRGLLDLLTMNLLPPLDGIYRQDFAPPGIDLQPLMKRSPLYRQLKIEGVVLSHAHLDHCGYISSLKPDIPIYTSAMTAATVKVIQDTGPLDFEKEACYTVVRCEKDGLISSPTHSRANPAPFIQRPYYVVDDMLNDSFADFWSSKPGDALRSRPLESFDIAASSSIGSLTIKRFPVDHSILGANAFAIQTELGWVVYTGDLRRHGRNRDQTDEFAQVVSKLNPIALICEGTQVDMTASTSEEEVAQSCHNEVSKAQGLVIADFASRNIERLLTFYQIAKDLGRLLVVTARDAYLLEAVRTVEPTLPDPLKDNTIRVLKGMSTRPNLWERGIYERYQENDKLVDIKDIAADQPSFILCFSFFDINALPDINPAKNSVYIYSTSEAYNEEQELDLWRLNNWLSYFGVPLVGGRGSGFHSSGHISGPELMELINTINPKVVIPIHTEKPEFFTDNLPGYDVRIPVRGKAIKIG